MASSFSGSTFLLMFNLMLSPMLMVAQVSGVFFPIGQNRFGSLTSSFVDASPYRMSNNALQRAHFLKIRKVIFVPASTTTAPVETTLQTTTEEDHTHPPGVEHDEGEEDIFKTHPELLPFLNNGGGKIGDGTKNELYKNLAKVLQTRLKTKSQSSCSKFFEAMGMCRHEPTTFFMWLRNLKENQIRQTRHEEAEGMVKSLMKHGIILQ